MIQFIADVIETADVEIVADTTAVGRDGFVVGDAIEMEEFLQTSKVCIGDADGLFVGQPLSHVFLVGIAALGGVLPSDEYEFHVVALGYLGAKFFALLDGGTAGATAHAPEVDDEIAAGVFG